MKKAKLLHILQIALLILLTAAISVTVATIGRRLFPVSAPADPSASAPSDAEDAGDALAETEWLPEIVYEQYSTSKVDPENFRSTVIIGNSQAQALSYYGLIKNADFVTRIGLSIDKVLTSKSGDPPIADLYGKQYQKAVFIFGENELGWPYPKNFISLYKKVIEKVRELNPGVEVYVQEIFPITADESAKGENGVTNENVRKFNVLIEEMCDEIGAHFMPASDAFFDADGVLPADAAPTDGVHFNYDYCKIWAGDLSAYLQQEAPVTSKETATTETTEMTETTEEGVTEG